MRVLAEILVGISTHGAGISCVTTITLTSRYCLSSKQQPVASDAIIYVRLLAEGCVAMTSTPVLEFRVRLGSVQCSVRQYAVGVGGG